MQEPRISVIVPVHNGATYLRRSLTSLFDSSYKEKEVIVVDDASGDGSDLIAGEFDCLLVRLEERGGPGRARNIGSASASGDILFFTDADVVVPPDLLGRIAETMSRRRDISALIGGYSKECGASNFVSVYKNLLHHFVHEKSRGEVSSFFTACGAIRRSVFDEHGGFDESERDCALEDVEMGMRLAKSGKKVFLYPELQVKHLKRYSLSTLVYADVWQRAVPYTIHMLRHRVFPDELSTTAGDRFRLVVAFLDLFFVLGGLIAGSALLLGAGFLGALLYHYLNHEFYRFLIYERGPWFMCRAAPLRYLTFIYSGMGLLIGVCKFSTGRGMGSGTRASVGDTGSGVRASQGLQVRANPNVLQIIPHQPERPPEGLVRLAYNENPLGPSPLAIEAIRRAAGGVNHYPDSRGGDLKEALAAKHGIECGNILLGQGASEIVELVMRTFVLAGDEVIIPFPTFPWYEMLARIGGAKVVGIPLRDHIVDLRKIAQSVTSRTRLIVMANPNNPTGTVVEQQEINEFLDSLPGSVLVLFDEAYIDYVEGRVVDAVSRISMGPVIVVRTFSKAMGLAGMRIGYAMADEGLIDLLSRIRRPYNTSHLAQMAATAALADARHLELTREVVRQGKELLYSTFDRLRLEYVRSETNFVLVDHHRDANQVFEGLRARGLLVRPMPPTGLRVSLGTEDENVAFVAALEEIVLGKNLAEAAGAPITMTNLEAVRAQGQA